MCTEQDAWEQGVAGTGDAHTAMLPGQRSFLGEPSSRKSHSPQAAVVFRGSCGGGFFVSFPELLGGNGYLGWYALQSRGGLCPTGDATTEG